MRILIVNDDGIEAEGIRRLASMATQFGEVWVIAPDNQCSAMSQRITLREKISIEEYDFTIDGVKRAYAIGGTPADCVKVALGGLMPHKPDYVFSGINWGYNAGYDVAYSGTVAAAQEAVMSGVPAIAYSNQNIDRYEVCEHYMPILTKEILEKEPLKDSIWNLNFPGCPLTECKGVLWERKVARLQYYQNAFVPEKTPWGTVLSVVGVPINDENVTEGTDIRALLDRYVSVGLVTGNAMQ